MALRQVLHFLASVDMASEACEKYLPGLILQSRRRSLQETSELGRQDKHDECVDSGQSWAPALPLVFWRSSHRGCVPLG